jgi:hydrogenase nickel incorporation protein HypA/HybF
MHESSLARQLLEAALAKADREGARRILAVRGWIAESEALSRESLEYHFSAHAKKTIAQDAKIEIRTIHVSARCADCGNTFMPRDHVTLCPRCGSLNCELLGRVGIGIDAIDIEGGGDS